jgi:hypothetical protein
MYCSYATPTAEAGVPIASQLRTFGSLVSGRVLEPVLARAFPVARAVIVFESIGKFGRDRRKSDLLSP